MKIQHTPSPNFNERAAGKPIDMIVIHYTDMRSAKAALQHLCDPTTGVSAHYLITMSGEIHQLVDDAKRAWHAGVSEWEGETDVNSRSIGIELDNPGHSHGYMPFPEVQIEALITLCQELQNRHSIPKIRVVGHEHVAPGRKQDPGPLFPWARLKAAGVSTRG